jgi:hypothetical protein
VGSTFRPTASNAVEHFFAAFERFYRQKGPFQSKGSADNHLALFLLGYVFSIRLSGNLMLKLARELDHTPLSYGNYH